MKSDHKYKPDQSYFVRLFGAQDYFGNHFNFRFNKDEKFRTTLGTTLSLVINCAILALLVSMSIELIGKKNPTVNSVITKESQGPNVTINTEDFFYSMRIVDKNFQFINDPSILQLEAKYSVTTANKTHFIQQLLNIEYKNCSDYLHLFEKLNITTDFYNNNLLHSICLGKSELGKEIVMGGKFGTEFYGSLEFNFKKCVNRSESPVKCKSEEEIDERLDRGWFQSAFINRYVDINDYDEPIKHYVDGFYGNVDPKLNKIIYSHFNKVKVLTDEGLIFNSNLESSTFKSDYMISDVNMLSKNNIIYTVYAISSFNQQIFFRKYMKLQLLAANIGGIIKSLVFMGMILVTFINKMKMDEVIMNKLWTFVYQPVKKEKQLPISQSNLPEQQVDFTLSYFDILRMKIFCCCKAKDVKRKEKVYHEVKDELDKYLDYTDILKSLQDIVKLKVVLLSPHQLVLFENIKLKYQIDSDQPFKTQHKFIKNESYNDQQIQESIHQLKQEDGNNFVTKKILENYSINDNIYDKTNNLEIIRFKIAKK